MQKHAAGSPRQLSGGGEFQADDSRIWEEAAAQRRWIYLQMEERLRRELAPLLVYFEVDTLVLCLRNLAAGQPDTTVAGMEQSLLREELKRLVLESAALSEVVAGIERYLKGSPLVLEGLAAAYEAKGLQGCEELIRRKFLSLVFSVCDHPAVVDFFRAVVDQYNAISLAKCLRWKKQDVPALFHGGHVRIWKADRTVSENRIARLVRRITGGVRLRGEELHPVRLEPLLHEHLLQGLTRRMRGGDPLVNCIGYVWHGYAAAKKRSGMYHAGRFADNFAGGSEV